MINSRYKGQFGKEVEALPSILDLRASNLAGDLSTVEKDGIKTKLSLEYNYTNIVEFGCIGDNLTDNLVNFLAAVTSAKQTKKPLYIPYGDFFLDNVDQIDLSGIDRIFGYGNLMVNPTADPTVTGRAVFEISGTKNKLKSGLSIAKEGFSLVIDPGEVINQGDTVFLVSLENILTGRDNDYKGQRLTVNHYDDITGDITFFEKFYFNINSATLFHNDYNPKIEIFGLNIFCLNDEFRTGLNVKYCTAYMYNIVSEGFKWSGLTIASSYSVLRGYRTTNLYATSTITSYGYVVGDLSLAYAYNINASGGRHAVVGSGAASFFQNELGLVNSERTARYGCISYVYDSTISSEKENALDAHEIVRFFKIINSTVNGGISMYNSDFVIDGCTINLMGLYPRIYTGSGRYSVENSTINASIVDVLYLNENAEEITFNNVSIFSVPQSGSVSTISYQGYFIGKLEFNNVKFFTPEGLPRRFLNIGSIKNLVIKKLYMENSRGIEIEDYLDRETISIDGATFEGGLRHIRVFKISKKLILNGIKSHNSDNYATILIDDCNDIFITNTEVSGGSGAGLYVPISTNVIMNNVVFSDNVSSDISVSQGNLIISNSMYDTISSGTTPNVKRIGCISNGQIIIDTQ